MPDFNFAITGIGSLPITDPNLARDFAIKYCDELPFWPQLPKRSFLENMYVQFSEGFPGAVIDAKEKKFFIDASKDLSQGVEEAFRRYLEEDLSFFAVTAERAAGFFSFLESQEKIKKKKALKFVKGQVIGPVSFGFSVTDASGKAVIHYKEFEELIPKFLSMKARFQIEALKKYFKDIIIFIDEPYLASLGSSFVNIDAGRAGAYMDEVAGEVKKCGALSGMHCCGNTDWGFMLARDIDILSFDAYNFKREFLLYKEDINKFLDKGKTIAWGIVPTDPEALEKENAASLAGRMESLKGAGLDKKRIAAQSIITPSCGCGTLSPEKSRLAFDLLDEVKVILRG